MGARAPPLGRKHSVRPPMEQLHKKDDGGWVGMRPGQAMRSMRLMS